MLFHPQRAWLLLSQTAQSDFLPQIILIADHIDHNIIDTQHLRGNDSCLREYIFQFHTVQLTDNAVQTADTVICIQNLTIQTVLYRQRFLIDSLEERIPFIRVPFLPGRRLALIRPTVCKITGQYGSKQIRDQMQQDLRLIKHADQIHPLLH